MAIMRIVKLSVQPTVVLDDGLNLYEVNVNPMEISGPYVHDFINGGLFDAIEQLRDRIENMDVEGESEQEQDGLPDVR